MRLSYLQFFPPLLLHCWFKYHMVYRQITSLCCYEKDIDLVETWRAPCFKHSTQCVAVLRKRAVQSHDSSVWIFYSAWLCKKKKKRKEQFRKYVYAWKTHKATEIYCLEWVLVYWIHNIEFACVYIWGKFHVFIYHYFLSI